VGTNHHYKLAIIIMEFLTEGLVLFLPFATSAVMFAAKKLSGLAATDNGSSARWLRILLMCVSLMGIMSTSALSGEPIQANVVTDWIKLIAETVVNAYFAHAFYKLGISEAVVG
jgi:hypothetical protein